MTSKSFEWVVCGVGQGHIDGRRRTLPEHSVGLVRNRDSDTVTVWLIGPDEVWIVPAKNVRHIDVTQTGDDYSQKICNRCHRLLDTDHFAINQRNKRRLVRRPTCRRCRTDIDKRPPKSRQAKQKEKERPQRGTPFTCPICRKRSIAYITAKIVADHDHHTGNIRDFICDSCNTGLGRFMNGKNVLRDALVYLEDRDTLGH